jgi:hypothetical protein
MIVYERRKVLTMADEEAYLYLNEGGFTPGMYESHKASSTPGRAATKRSSWWWIPGFDRGEKRDRQADPDAKQLEV